ncbi:MAG: thioredoxin family protein [Candidatus Nanoarchaeia archaeon]|nr:thioredoxin family protein [Candidatus Haiyanarchaeum thermophilum]MCW1303065.1 thioredoxin family protein [Candidatus Haiyanarchaeum thermophilum]MCW1303730.1 thioredoxin family protein [Candidatus Haiyanarchaeum thermophilum]MCW1306825.1 thioredoxin family protein [Candidatus Haiyanarchaeum thermophilum]MCW1307067.1 thioredoxin family protein [Candidatus Haiyanarchaeum thermophilum]
MLELNSSELDEVLKQKGLIAIDFWSPNCIFCRMLAPNFEMVSKQFKMVKFATCNIAESPEVAEKYEILGVPTIIFFKDGREVARVVGYKSYEELAKIVKELIEKP